MLYIGGKATTAKNEEVPKRSLRATAQHTAELRPDGAAKEFFTHHATHSTQKWASRRQCEPGKHTIFYDPEESTLDDWLAAHPPNTLGVTVEAVDALSVDITEWTHVPGPDVIREIAAYDSICEHFKTETKHTPRDKEVARTAMLEVATNLGHTEGKWLFPCPPDKVIEAWSLLARAAVCGNMPQGHGLAGCAVSVAPKLNLKGVVVIYLLAVRCPDSNDEEHLRRVLLYTRDLLQAPEISCQGFKPEIFSRLGVYAKDSTHPDRRCINLRSVMMHTDWTKEVFGQQ
ncbi:protein of unknown function DUF1917 [Kipferlia bialata]|uniref:Uncharacterized protein n=1 Tax=Kipferlia bialata TaxID=797122 RepID=A0A9K3CMN8_9EUKA|nr:protein of unknown function DUF1917 [Kipferlia bialata]|eukprot:g541.t1